ncbi:MAG: Kae1-associated serine/threonine protein kinase [Candidatus Aenigmarchaeota archaeon]|nr:Kae1-associated serine/threonine protein kinase [Candidatus Aenigmarchaeota archaeon]
MTGKEIIQRGAEAIIYLEEGKVVKERISKGYRVPEIDRKIRKQRTKAEAKLMIRAADCGANVPNVTLDDDFKLVMDHLKGEKVKDILNDVDNEKRADICSKMGEIIAKIHSSGIIHGDLTTSNMILVGNDVYFIDFGLGKFSEKVEDQAVDLFLLNEALNSTHTKFLSECWEKIISIYSKKHTKAKEVISRMEKIKSRRRYK